MFRKKTSAGVLMLALFVTPVGAAEDSEMRHKLDALERQQEHFSDELRRLREEVEHTAPARVEEVERRQGIMTEELRRLREALVLPETKELKSAYGLGPAASKVYGIQRGLSIGGYGETNFRAAISDKQGTRNEFDFLRFVLYVGYKYNDWIVFNSETEFEHATTESTVSSGDGSVSIEFASVDFLLHPAANVRAGLVLVPMGFINEIHEPPFFHGNVRAQVEQQIIPSTWRANGFGLFGEPLPGLQYRTYGITSLNAKGFAPNNLREARQSGNRERAHDWSWVGRVDYAPIRQLTLGGSALLGDQGQNQNYGNPEDGLVQVGVFTQIYEAHAEGRTHGLEVRLLGAYVDIDDADQLSRDTEILKETKNTAIGEVLLGGYGEIAYDIMPLLWPGTTHYLAPWFRYSWIDTQNAVPSSLPAGVRRDPGQRREIYEVGLSYKPIPQVIFKLDYRVQDRREGDLPDEIRLGGGFVF